MTEGCNSWLILFESFAQSRCRVRNFLDSRFSILLGLGFQMHVILSTEEEKKKSSHRSSEFLNRQLD